MISSGAVSVVVICSKQQIQSICELRYGMLLVLRINERMNEFKESNQYW